MIWAGPSEAGQLALQGLHLPLQAMHLLHAWPLAQLQHQAGVLLSQYLCPPLCYCHLPDGAPGEATGHSALKAASLLQDVMSQGCRSCDTAQSHHGDVILDAESSTCTFSDLMSDVVLLQTL